MQEWAIDMWARTERQTLDWYRANQSTIRPDLYRGLADCFREYDNDPGMYQDQRRQAEQGRQHGTKVVLPATFHGGSRHMNKLYQVRSSASPLVFPYSAAMPPKQ